MWQFIQKIIFSIIIIILLHYFWEYLKTTYTTSKTKNIVKIQTDKYNSILSEMFENIQTVQPSMNISDMEEDLAIFLESSLVDNTDIAHP